MLASAMGRASETSAVTNARASCGKLGQSNFDCGKAHVRTPGNQLLSQTSHLDTLHSSTLPEIPGHPAHPGLIVCNLFLALSAQSVLRRLQPPSSLRAAAKNTNVHRITRPTAACKEFIVLKCGVADGTNFSIVYRCSSLHHTSTPVLNSQGGCENFVMLRSADARPEAASSLSASGSESIPHHGCSMHARCKTLWLG